MPHDVSESGPEGQLLHVLDLPQLYEKPSADELIATLTLLIAIAPSWSRQGDHARPSVQVRVAPEGIPKYLTSIIASPLSWIHNDEQKEAIWEQASLRLAERSGRTAMPAMSRSFSVNGKDSGFEILIHEPSLTGDSLGLKTWAASYLLANRFAQADLPRHNGGKLRVLELGAGTGLVGMAVASTSGASVLLTDMAEIEENLTRNVLQNEQMILARGGAVSTAVLDWARPNAVLQTPSSHPPSSKDSQMKLPEFPVIVAADSIYSAEHPAMLVNTIMAWLAPGPDARVIIELPRRSGYVAELEDFQARMLTSGLRILEEGEEVGYDDWRGSMEDELEEVPCWWSIWSWAT